ncbi:disulfide isomerase-like 5-4 [Olea europaea subsp. europaea]|uniref:Disulfide isomerase-like 5-4 n=1 Tax=Olea europaea subsp. europaea TaxID=158383 RepID=A0A8S0PHI5_OLEEU|nr:disulfide isomerase-like 5-4 [Olea europaea subsp. europaea]
MFVQEPSWAKAAKTIRERYDPEIDGRILMGMVDCTVETELCRRHHINGYPSIRIFRNGSDIRDECDDNGWHQFHESYYGDRDTNSLVKAMENLVAPVSLQLQKVASDSLPAKTNDDAKKPALLTGGCRIEGSLDVKKVPGNLIISASSASHSLDASQLNMSHIISHFSFGKKNSRRVMIDMRRMLPYIGGSHDWSRLNGKSYISNPSDSYANITIEHYLQVVKTEVMTRSHKLFMEYEYTTRSSLVHSLDFPVAKFHFEPSQMKVFINQSKSSSRFFRNVRAIIGIVTTVVGILHVIMYNMMRAKASDRESELVGV